MSEQQLTGFAAKAAREAGAIPAGDLRPEAAREYPELRPPVPAAEAAAYSLDPAGVPVRSGVPDDFAAAQEAAVVSSGQLTAEEVAEFRALRAEKKARDEQAARDAAEAAARLQAPTHHVHLADGTILAGSQIATHYAMPDGRTVAVSGAYEITPQLAT